MGKLENIIKKLLEFRDERDWLQFHDPKNLAEAITIESSELLELFLWSTIESSYDLDDTKIQSIKNEVADIFIFMAYLCNHYKIDLLEAVEKKIEQNSLKYPINRAKGLSSKYNKL